MASWMPILTGAVKGAAQKLVSLFTNAKAETEKDPFEDPNYKFSEDTKKDPFEDPSNPFKLVNEPQKRNSEEVLTQPREVEDLDSPDQDVHENAVPISGKGAVPSLPSDNSAELIKFFQRDRDSQKSSTWENEEEPRLPDIPGWSKAVIGASGATAGSHFAPSGDLTAGQFPAGEPPQGQLAASSTPSLTQQADSQSTLPEKPEEMKATEQVVPGYSRTERLLELMLLRGIPSLKPPRGP